MLAYIIILFSNSYNYNIEAIRPGRPLNNSARPVRITGFARVQSHIGHTYLPTHLKGGYDARYILLQ